MNRGEVDDVLDQERRILRQLGFERDAAGVWRKLFEVSIYEEELMVPEPRTEGLVVFRCHELARYLMHPGEWEKIEVLDE